MCILLAGSLLLLFMSVFVEKQEAKELGTISIMSILLGFSNAVIHRKPDSCLPPLFIRAAVAASSGRQAAGAVGGPAE